MINNIFVEFLEIILISYLLFLLRSGIVCWWCSPGSCLWPDLRASSWNSVNGCQAPVKRMLFWEWSPPFWHFSSRFSLRSDHIRTRRRDLFSTGSIGWSEMPPTYFLVSTWLSFSNSNYRYYYKYLRYYTSCKPNTYCSDLLYNRDLYK